jgi:hypothetical protein
MWSALGARAGRAAAGMVATGLGVVLLVRDPRRGELAFDAGVVAIAMAGAYVAVRFIVPWLHVWRAWAGHPLAAPAPGERGPTQGVWRETDRRERASVLWPLVGIAVLDVAFFYPALRWAWAVSEAPPPMPFAGGPVTLVGGVAVPAHAVLLWVAALQYDGSQRLSAGTTWRAGTRAVVMALAGVGAASVGGHFLVSAILGQVDLFSPELRRAPLALVLASGVPHLPVLYALLTTRVTEERGAFLDAPARPDAPEPAALRGQLACIAVGKIGVVAGAAATLFAIVENPRSALSAVILAVGLALAALAAFVTLLVPPGLAPAAAARRAAPSILWPLAGASLAVPPLLAAPFTASAIDAPFADAVYLWCVSFLVPRLAALALLLALAIHRHDHPRRRRDGWLAWLAGCAFAALWAAIFVPEHTAAAAALSALGTAFLPSLHAVLVRRGRAP